MSRDFSSRSLWISEPVLSPERILWRGVLGLAYEDAELPQVLEEQDELFIEQIRARRYLRADTRSATEGLKLVCDFAEIPFDRVVLWARKQYPLPADRREVLDVKEINEAKEEQTPPQDSCNPLLPSPGNSDTLSSENLNP